MAKGKTVTERRLARLARVRSTQQSLPGAYDAGSLPPESIPHEALTPPPMPGPSTDMAAGGLPLVRGNSSAQPMSPQGHATAQHVGRQLAAMGGPDQIVPSTSARAMETAQDVSGATGAPVSPPVPGLESRALGQLEGEHKTPEVKSFLRSTIRNLPNYKIHGQGAMSNKPGESFNEFKQRAITALRGLMQRLASAPQSRIIVPTSSQVIRLAKAWCDAGCPDDFSVDVNTMGKDDDGKPGEIERLFPEPSGQWGVTPFSPKSSKEFAPGIYLMRHGETDAVQAQGASAGQKARAQIIAHVRAGNYAGARKAGQDATTAGHMTDDDVSSAVDEALPDGASAGQLPPEQLLAAASAASPTKRAELMPALQQKFADLSGVEPQGQHHLRSHLGRLGMRA
jgi:broad specificity phosphatase PhoE